MTYYNTHHRNQIDINYYKFLLKLYFIVYTFRYKTPVQKVHSLKEGPLQSLQEESQAVHSKFET